MITVMLTLKQKNYILPIQQYLTSFKSFLQDILYMKTLCKHNVS